MPYRISRLSLVLACLAGTAQAAEDPKGETLVQSLPLGYNIGYGAVKGNMRLSEYISSKETIQNWSQMITTQTFVGMHGADPVQMLNNIQKLWLHCKDSSVETIRLIKSNGYIAATTQMTCPLSPVTHKPEYTLMKAIEGNDNFYIVQKSFTFQPSMEQLEDAQLYLSGIKVCDARHPQNACSTNAQ